MKIYLYVQKLYRSLFCCAAMLIAYVANSTSCSSPHPTCPRQAHYQLLQDSLYGYALAKAPSILLLYDSTIIDMQRYHFLCQQMADKSAQLIMQHLQPHLRFRNHSLYYEASPTTLPITQCQRNQLTLVTPIHVIWQKALSYHPLHAQLLLLQQQYIYHFYLGF